MNTCRLLVAASAAVLNDPELSNIEKILYSVLYAERMASVIVSLNEILGDSYFFFRKWKWLSKKSN